VGSVTLTISRWMDLPSLVDPSLAADEPLGADVMQVAASTATYGARVNNLRILWEHPGSTDVSGDVGYAARPESFPWDTDPAAADPVFTAFAGVHRLRPYGEGSAYPKITLRARVSAPSGNNVGLILVVRPAPGRPSADDLFGVVLTASMALTSKSITLAITPGAVGVRPVVPQLGVAYPPPEPPERGTEPVVAIYVGAWMSGMAGGKAVVAGITIHTEAP
jgi:hypothetical protein